MKREVIYRTDAMAAIGNLKGLSDTDKSKAMQAILDVLTVPTCDDAVSRADVLETYADLYDVFEDSKAICKELHKVYDRINALPAIPPQTEEDCNTCKHGFLGSRQCDNCRMRYPVHYEREEEQQND